MKNLSFAKPLRIGKWCAWQKAWMVMRLTVVLIIISTFTLSAKSYSQKISLSLHNSPLENAFKQIGQKTGYSFLWSEQTLKGLPHVSVLVHNASLKEAVQACLKGLPLTYAIHGKVVSIERKIVPPLTISPQAKPLVLPLHKVTGLVTDSVTGNPLVAVTIQVKGSTIGTTTDKSGRFSLSVPDGAVLVVSYVGYDKKEIPVSEESVINISMSASATGLSQLVVVGYGTQTIQDITGAVSVADLNTYRDVPVNNILEMIKGTIPGLNIGGINSAGAVGSMSIRGQNSISGSNTPLIVVDGSIYHASLADISPYDIKSLTVLKDASAAAIYGSRSANGVILIETKGGSGIDGKPKFNAEFDYGISNELKPLQVYDPKGYIQKLFDYRRANGMEVDPSKIAIYLQPEERKNYEATPDHKPTTPRNPVGLLLQPAYNRKVAISVSNNTSRTSYYISTTLTDQHGVVLNDNFKHLSARVNLASDLTNWFNISVKNSFSLRDYSGSSPSLYWADELSPWASVYNADGSYKQFPQTTTSFNSPFWEMATEDKAIDYDLNSMVSGIIKIPWVQGLSYKINFGNTLRWSQNYDFYNNSTEPGVGKNGYGEGSNPQNYDMLLDNIIHYNRIFLGKHHIDLTLLYSREHNTAENVAISSRGMENQVLGYYGLKNGQIQSINTSASETNSLGQMARLTYTYSDKYTLTGTIRRDGYSEFSKNKKWGTFPSVGVNWNITGENFMKNIIPVDHLDLRASYGTMGNQSISNYSTLAKVSTGYYVFYDPPSTTVLTQHISSFPNNNLSWETVTGTDIGIDFSLFKSRIDGTIDLYNKRTHNLLFTLPLPAASGAGSILANAGEIKNKGLEVEVHTLNINRKDFQWRSDIAFSLNRNKVGELLGTGDLVSSGLFIGRPLSSIYAYKVIGMWQQADTANHTIMKGMRPGDYKLKDVNGDGKITSDSDRVFLGTGKPNFRWSWTNTFTYKGFSLMVYVYSIWGGDDYYLSGSNTPYFDVYADRGDINHPVYDYWTPSNTGALFPRLDYEAHARYKGVKYFDRSFIKLQKIALSYDLTPFVRPKGIHHLRVTLSADNLLTYAPHWVGLDPETNSGLTYGSYPSIRTYLLSVSFDF